MTETDRTIDGDRAPGQWAVWSRPGIVLSVGAALTAFALVNVIAADPGSLPAFAPFVILSFAAIFATAYALVLSFHLAMMVTAGLLTALIWTLGALALMSAGFAPSVLFAVLAVEAVGAALTLQEISQLVLEICRGAPGPAAAWLATRRSVWPGSAAILSVLCAIAASAFGGWLSLYAVWAVGLAAGGALALLLFWLLPAQAGHVAFEETYIDHLNRTRERRERLFAPAGIVGESRWAFSLTGTVAVLIAIVYFQDAKFAIDLGAGRMPVLAALWHLTGFGLVFAVFATGMIGVWATRDWRACIAIPLPPFLGAVIGCVIAGHLKLASPSSLAFTTLAVGGSGAGLATLLGIVMATYRRFGDSVALGSARMAQDATLIVLLVGFAAIAAALFFAAGFLNGLATAVSIAVTLCSTLILFPALTAVLADLFPRRRTLEQIYSAR